MTPELYVMFVKVIIVIGHLFHLTAGSELCFATYHVQCYCRFFYFQHKFILKNARYTLETLMKKIEEQFKARSISFPKQLVSVSGKYKKLESLSKSSGS